MKEIEIKVKGMVCEGCENRLKAVLSVIDGVKSVEANHNSGIVTVNAREDIDITILKEAIVDIGFEVVEG